jgi:hypothetical protein
MASNIVLADAQATPVNHTFVPMGRDKNGVYWFEDQSATSAIGYWKISVELVKPAVASAKQNSEGRTVRVKVALHEPVLETVSNNTISGIAPAPTVSYVPRSYQEFVLPERATLQNRKDLRKMAASLLAESQVTSVIETLAYIQ